MSVAVTWLTLALGDKRTPAIMLAWAAGVMTRWPWASAGLPSLACGAQGPSARKGWSLLWLAHSHTDRM